MSNRPTVLVFAASNSTTSINMALAMHAADVLKNELATDIDIETLDLNDFEMPIYSPEREAAGGVPQLAKDFLAQIGAADALIIAYAEYNGHYTAAFKNVFDWCSRVDGKVYQNKPQVVLSTSPGGGGAASVLKAVIDSSGYFGADIKGSLSVASFYDVFDMEAGKLTDPALAASLREALLGLKAEL